MDVQRARLGQRMLAGTMAGHAVFVHGRTCLDHCRRFALGVAEED
jgi:hypothetical protein